MAQYCMDPKRESDRISESRVAKRVVWSNRHKYYRRQQQQTKPTCQANHYRYNHSYSRGEGESSKPRESVWHKVQLKCSGLCGEPESETILSVDSRCNQSE